MTGSLISNPDGGRILLVDDDDPNRYAKRRILQQAGYRVLEAITGTEALRLTKAEHPDLVLLDVRLPDMSGFDVCREIKADPSTASTLVLQMSASFRDDQSKVTGLQGGADGYIAEPIEPSLLVATIGAFLRTRRAEQSTRQHALEWQVTFDAITDGVALVDTSAHILRANRSLAALLGRRPDELPGTSLESLLSGSADGFVVSQLETGERRREERTANGRMVSVSVDPVRDQSGTIRGGVCIVSDITERKLLDQHLWHTQKLESIGVLAGGVAHDFNNLLMGILGNASLALEALDDPVAASAALHDIVGAGERAADLTRQLLAYSGKGKFVVQPVDLSQLVEGMVPLVQAAFARKINIALDLESDLPAIEADKTQLEQVIMNLLINAAEAIGDHSGTVHVTTAGRRIARGERTGYLSEFEVSGDYIMLEVRDDGAGMDEQTVRRIFDPFFTTKFLGRGLGLSAVLGIMRGHKGAIRVASSPGHGTTFELLFPSTHALAPAHVELAAPDQPADLAPVGTALVVDDEPIVRNLFKSVLERNCFEAVVAEDGAQAIRIFSESPDRFSVILLDLVMPKMSGQDALPRLLEIRPDIPIIVTSGRVEEEVRRELQNFVIAGFIQKPCTVQAFIHKVRSFTGLGLMAAH